jgi:hypothetical protein
MLHLSHFRHRSTWSAIPEWSKYFVMPYDPSADGELPPIHTLPAHWTYWGWHVRRRFDLRPEGFRLSDLVHQCSLAATILRVCGSFDDYGRTTHQSHDDVRNFDRPRLTIILQESLISHTPALILLFSLIMYSSYLSTVTDGFIFYRYLRCSGFL